MEYACTSFNKDHNSTSLQNTLLPRQTERQDQRNKPYQLLEDGSVARIHLHSPFCGLFTQTHSVLTKVDQSSRLIPSSPSSHSEGESPLLSLGRQVLKIHFQMKNDKCYRSNNLCHTGLVCFVALRPKSTAMVMAVWSVT